MNNFTTAEPAEIKSPPIEGIGPDSLSVAEKRQLVARIATSPQLNKSVRLTELLTYLTEKSITRTSDGLREQEIGTNLFGRDPDYDTGQDNIVRVQVSQLRKKLIAYFNQSGREEPVIIEIPRGGYLPVFVKRSLPVAEPASDRSRSIVSQPLILVLLLFILLTIIFAGLTFRLWSQRQNSSQLHTRHAPANESGSQTGRTALQALWRNILNPDRQTDVVLADSTLTILQDRSGRPLSLGEMLQRKFDATLPAGLPENERNDILSIVARRYTSFTDVELVGKILQIRLPDQNVPTFNIAREYQMRAFKAHNIILLGSKRSNPWVELIEPRMNFRFQYSERQSDPIITNQAPQYGERPDYIPGRNGIGYSVVAFLPNINQTGAVLILEGDNSISTEAAGEFVSSDEHLARFFSQIGYDPASAPSPPWFEVLLQTEKLQGVTKSFQIVGYRLISR